VPKLLAIDRKLRTLSRRLVTDAGGAPCCCVGSHPQCCDSSWQCLPRYVAQCVNGQFRADYCRDARAMTENVTLTVSSQRVFTVSNGYRLFTSTAAQFVFVLCRPSGLPMTILPEFLAGYISINETRNGAELYRFESAGETLGIGSYDSSQWPVQYQTAGRGPTSLGLLFPFVAARETFAGANVEAAGSAPIVGPGGFFQTTGAIGAGYKTAGPQSAACSGSLRQDLDTGFNAWTWNASDSCDGPASIASRFESGQDFTQRGLRVVESTFSDYQLTATRQWCLCETTNQISGGCSNCGDRSTLEPFV
jgi:hypothetical protein